MAGVNDFPQGTLTDPGLWEPRRGFVAEGTVDFSNDLL
jgi:hypothetical protein